MNQETWRRLHPWGLVREFRPLATGLFYLAVSGQGWSVVADVAAGQRRALDNLELAVVAMLLPYGLAKFWRRRYQLTADSLSMRSGLFVLNEKTIERTRIQNVECTTSPFQRVLGITTVTVTEPSGRSSIKLDPVSRAVSEHLVAALQDSHLAPDGDVPGAGVEDPPAVDQSGQPPPAEASNPPEPTTISVPWPKIALANFVSASVLGALGLVAVVGVVRPELIEMPLLVLALTLLVAGQRSARMASFKLAADGQLLSTSVGPLTNVRQGIRPDQIQSIRVGRTWLKRRIGLETVSFSSAEVGPHAERHLAPVWPLGTWPRLAQIALPELTVTEDSLEPIGRRTVERYRRVGAFVAAALAAGALAYPALWAVLALWLPVGLWWYPAYRHRRFGIGLSGEQLIARTGLVVEKVHVTDTRWIEEVRVRQSPTQRRLGLANLRFSGLGSENSITVPDLDHARAWELADVLAARSEARRTPASPVAPIATGQVDRSAHLAPLPDQVVALWRWYALAIGLAVLVLFVAADLVAAMWFEWLPTPPLYIGALCGPLISAVMAALAPVYHRQWVYSITPTVVLISHGVVQLKQASIRRDRVHSIETAGDPIERRYGLASLTFRSPGDGGHDLVLPHVPAELAGAVQRELNDSNRPGDQAAAGSRRPGAEAESGGSDESPGQGGDGWQAIAAQSVALWRIRAVATLLAVGGLFAFARLLIGARWQPLPDLRATAGVAVGLGLCLVGALLHAPRHARSWRYRIDDDTVVLEWGVYWRRRAVIPRSRVVTFETAAGPVRRRLGIRRLQLWTGHSPEPLIIPGLSAQAVAELRDTFGFGGAGRIEATERGRRP